MKKQKFNETTNKGEIVIYETSKKEVELKVRLEKENIWLTQAQIAKLYTKDRTVITKHISNVFKDREVDEESNVQKMHFTHSDKPTIFYSLDIVLAVGYRTNSSAAIKFRRWATGILKNYILRGYAINEKRFLEANEKFQELKTVISFLQERASKKQLKGQEKEILNLLAGYSKTLRILEQYDKEKLVKPRGKKARFILEYKNCLRVIIEVKKELVAKKEAADIFGTERERGLESIVKNLYQTFGGKELYKSLEGKAAHILYLIIKDHPFSDGNKRIGSFLFVYFLDKNNYLYRETGEKKINDNALTALALLIAESNPKDKDVLVKIIINLITEQ